MSDKSDKTYDFIEVPTRAQATALFHAMVMKAIPVSAEPQDDTTWTFRVEARHGALTRQLLAQVS